MRSETSILFYMIGIGIIIWALNYFHQQGLTADAERGVLLKKEMNSLRQYVAQAKEAAQVRINAMKMADNGPDAGMGIGQIGPMGPPPMPPNNPIANIPLPNTRPGAFGMPVNLPTRGQPTDFYVVGYLFKEKRPNQMLQLFEKYWGSSRYEYITYNHNNPNITLPVYNNNWNQLTDGDCVKVQGYKGLYTVALYPSPLYNFLG